MDTWALIVFYVMESLGSWGRFEEADVVSVRRWPYWNFFRKECFLSFFFLNSLDYQFITLWITSLSQSTLKAMDQQPDEEIWNKEFSVPMEFGALHRDMGKISGSPTQKLSGCPPVGFLWFDFLREASLNGHERLNHWPVVTDLECWSLLHGTIWNGHLHMSKTGNYLQLHVVRTNEF